MRTKLSLLMFAVTIASALQIWATVLPDSCGADKIKFKVTKRKGQPAPSGPTASKAQVIIVENPDIYSPCLGPACDVTVRIGIDGEWAGASQGKSYFAFLVAPGEHHVCANWQSTFATSNKLVSMASFTAEAGKVYYYEVKPVMRNMSEHRDEKYKLELMSLSEDEGKYGVKISALSTSTPKR